MKRRFGWAFIEPPSHISSGLLQVYSSLPPHSTTDNHGHRPPKAPAIHATFLSRIPSSASISDISATLQPILSASPPLRVRLGKPSISRVDRITSKRISAAFVPLYCPELRPLRQKCAEAIGATVYYEGDGHISLAYVLSKHEDLLEEIVDRMGPTIEGLEFEIGHVVLELGGSTIKLSLQK